eukprot:TRINITY_DN19549_c0_g1_i1.p1 TRINITY_DN19549_c0_g1~~TRINITY_DN19549_c0_g1_i1.p1  ORF type:complete len:451 (+),score=21.04 TRINITY_DN19549_c0_g1_i1:75-1427(+)
MCIRDSLSDGSTDVAGICSVTLNPGSTATIDNAAHSPANSHCGEYIGVGYRGSSHFEPTWGPSVHPSLLHDHMAEDPTLLHTSPRAVAISAAVPPPPSSNDTSPPLHYASLNDHQHDVSTESRSVRDGEGSQSLRLSTADPIGVEVVGGVQTSLVKLYNHRAVTDHTHPIKTTATTTASMGTIPQTTTNGSVSEIPSSSFRGVLFLPMHKQPPPRPPQSGSGDLATTTSISYPTMSSHPGGVQRGRGNVTSTSDSRSFSQVGGGIMLLDQPTPHVLTPIIVLTSATEVTEKISKLQVHRLKSNVIITDRVAAHVPSPVLRFSAPVDCVELQASYVGPPTASRINHAVYKHYHLPALEAKPMGVPESASPTATNPHDPTEAMMFSRSFDMPSVPQPVVSAPSMRSSSCLLYTSDAADEEDSVDLGGRRIIKKKKDDTSSYVLVTDKCKNML